MTREAFIKIKEYTFKYLLSKLMQEKNVENYLINREEINIPDFGRYKVFKLLFFVATVEVTSDTTQNGLLGIFDDFRAYPAGPVEEDIYKSLNKGAFPFTITNSSGLTISLNDFDTLENELNTTYPVVAKKIDSSIRTLKETNSKLIEADATYLVKLSHEWLAWQVVSPLRKGSNIGEQYQKINYFLIKNETRYFK